MPPFPRPYMPRLMFIMRIFSVFMRMPNATFLLNSLKQPIDVCLYDTLR